MTDREHILFGVDDSEERLVLSHMCDLYRKSEKTQKILYTRFMTPRQILLAKERFGGVADLEFGGGFDDAERCMAAFVPNDREQTSFPLCGIDITNTGKRELSHRDYLGALLSLGITRDKIGDIVVTPKGAVAVVCTDIADFIANNLTKVASCGIKIEIVHDMAGLVIEKKFSDTSCTVSSMRLDCIVSGATGKSRSQSVSLIAEGLVSVNYSQEKNVSHIVKNGDVVTIRGFGKMIVQTDMSLTKKGRIHINIRKYV